MSELPKGWADSSLGEITVLRGEKLDPSTLPDAPFIGLEDIEPHTSRILKTGKGSDVKSSVARFSAGNILYSRLRPYLNKVTVPDFDGIASAEILVLQPTAATEAEFVRRRIMTREFLDFAALQDKGDRPRVNFKEISEFPVALPPLPEQRRIVAKVDGLTARTARARKELDRIPTLIARYKKAVLIAAMEGNWAKQSRRTAVRLREAIEEIRTGPFGTAVHKHDYVEGGVPLINPMHINDGRITPTASVSVSPEKARDLNAFSLCLGEVIIARRGVMGRCAVIGTKEVGWLIGTGSIAIRPRPNVNPEFLQRYLSSPKVVEALEENSVGSTMTNLNQSVLMNLEIILPPIEEQTEIVRRIESAFGWLDRMAGDHAAAARLLPKLDAAILAKAFRGKLVPQDPNDEPASALLQRIKADRTSAGASPKREREHARQQTQTMSFPTIERVAVVFPPTFSISEPARSRKPAMTKSRQDDDVNGKPYLAGKLKSGRFSDAQSLFREADLPVDEFYKQLAWEIAQGYILDSADELKAA